jgi:hypothetical protein
VLRYLLRANAPASSGRRSHTNIASFRVLHRRRRADRCWFGIPVHLPDACAVAVVNLEAAQSTSVGGSRRRLD